jgi:prophage DNA circulation protein
MKDYTFIRPGIAVSISAATLALALVIGFWLIVSLRGAAATVENGARTVETLHKYNAGLEVWRQMVTSTDPAYRRPEAIAQRDSIGRALREQLSRLGNEMSNANDRELVLQVLEGLTRTDPAIGTQARQAMIVLLAKQDSAMFKAAETSQKAVLLSAVLLGLTVVAAGTLVIPMAWLYIRYKRGATIEVKV